MLPKLAFTSFASRYRAPKLEEGFKEIIKVDFVVSVVQPLTRHVSHWLVRCSELKINRGQFTGSDAQKELWSKYWI